MTKTNTPATPGQAVEQAREVLARWEAELAAATAELESVRDRAGSEVLDDPKAAERLPRVIGDLTARVDIAERAIRAQRPRVVDAERAYLLSEADKLRPAVKRAEGALQRHHEKTTELLRLLEEHEGPFVPKALLDFEENQSSAVPHEYVLTRSEVMENELAALRRPVLVLEELASGRDPMLHPDLRDCVPDEVHPACVWGPDALVPSQAYLESVRRADVAALQRENARAQLQAKIVDLEEKVAAGQERPPGLQHATMAQYPAYADQLTRVRQALRELDGEQVDA